MAETQTPNFHWTKPDLGGDASTWGNVLNTTFDAIDSVVYANQQAGVPIGAITMFGGATPPANWLICDGSSRATTGTYAALFAAIGYAFGGSGANFNLPNLVQHFPLGAGPSNALAATGGVATVTLDATMIPAHSHPIVQNPHGHGASATASGGAHFHGITDISHTHSVNAVFGGGSDIASGSGWGQHNVSSGGNVTGITTTNSATPAISVSVGVAPIVANIVGDATSNTGGGLSHNNMPPFVALNFIIRFS